MTHEALAAAAPDEEPQLDAILTSPARDAAYGRLADGPPVRRGYHFGGTGLWVVSGYDEIVTVLNDSRFSNDLSRQNRVPLPGAGLPDDIREALTSTLAAYDPPDHTRLRRLVSHAFTVRRIQRLRPRVRELVTGLLESLPEHTGPDGSVDLMEHFAHQIPILVIGELLGVSTAEQVRWRSSAAGLASGDPARTVEAARALVQFMTDEIAARRSPTWTGDDLFTALVRARDDDDRLSEAEVVSMALSILIAGHRTTAFLVRAMAVLVLTGAVRSPGPDRIPNLVEEVLRRHGPAEVGTLRVATERVPLAGVAIEEGDLVQVVLAGGNRDSRRFADPAALDPARQDNAHLAFGHGMHYCLGASLARIMAHEALSALLLRAPAMTPVGQPSLAVTDPSSAVLAVQLDGDGQRDGRRGLDQEGPVPAVLPQASGCPRASGHPTQEDKEQS